MTAPQQPTSRRAVLEAVAVLGFAALVGTLVAVRAAWVDRNIGEYIACPGCLDMSVLVADLPMVAALAAGLLLAGWLRWRWPGRVLHLAVGLVLFVYVADLVVFRLFNTRLFLVDAGLYVREWAAVWNQFSSGVGGAGVAWAIVGALTLLLAALWYMPRVRSRLARVPLASVVLLATAGAVGLERPAFVNDWAVDNVFAANLSSPEREPYTEAHAQRLGAWPEPERITTDDPPAAGLDVVIVLLESWSPWHSRLFGGEADWTPRLDAAAERGLRFTDFHAIGFSTDKGLVGILAGQDLWAPFLHGFEVPPFHSMWGVERTLPKAFSRAGYHTAFLTSGPLDLYEKGEWMSDIGFEHVEGNEHPHYQNAPRYAFDAASDRELYARALDWQRAAPAPYLLVLETVTTHQPYEDPDSGERSLEKAMRYADREFGAYLEALDRSGFFEGGWLVVVSDHRSMTPVSADERARFGPGTFSRVPAFAIGKGLPAGAIDDRVLSQGDLVPGFEWAVGGATKLAEQDALVFDPARVASKCALHARSDRRGLVEVICPEGHGQVRLEGDRTRFVAHTALDDTRREAIIAWIARQRLAALARHRAHASDQP